VRASTLAAHPRTVLAVIAFVSAAAHALLALRIHSILYFPDEWLYAGLSRSVTDGPFGYIHGARVSPWATISYLGPVLTSPVWLLDDVSLAHHLSQAAASLAFASAVAPAYLLARRLALGTGAALAAAALSQLVPAGAFTATLLAEPYAYPLFLWATLAAVVALQRPGVRQLAVVAAVTVLLLVTGGLQFLVFPIAFAAAWLTMTTSLRAFAVRLGLTAAGIAGVAALASATGGGSIVQRVIGSAESLHYSVGGILGWVGVNAFVLAVASGWIIVPAALVGLGATLGSENRARRGFGRLSVLLLAGLLCEAGLWSANGNGIYERFTFYASPLLVLAFLCELGNVEGRPRRGRLPYAALAYGAAAAAVLLPLGSRIADNQGHSPTLLALTDGLAVRVASASVVWAPLLAVLAVGAAAAGGRHGRLLLGVGAALLAVTSASAIRSLQDYDSESTPRVAASAGTALLVNPALPRYEFSVQRTLFWSPHLDRLVVVGGGGPPDMLPAGRADLAPPHALVEPGDAAVEGPFAVGADTSAWRDGRLIADGGPAMLPSAPDTLAFGWAKDGELAPVVELLAAGNGTRTRRLAVRVSSSGGRVEYGARCTEGVRRPRSIDIGGRATELVIVVPANASQQCRLAARPSQGRPASTTPRVTAQLTELRAAAANLQTAVDVARQ
jgi:hypothetical protein